MTALVLAALAVAVVELEGVDAGQFMFSRPLILGPMMGLAFHRFDFGAAVGALVEMFSFEALPVGGSIPANATVAAGSALLLSLGAAPVPIELAFPSGLVLGWAYARLEGFLRRRRARYNGTGRGLVPTILRSLAWHLAATAAFMLAAVLAARPALAAAYPLLPAAARSGLAAGFKFAPWLGAAALARALWPR